MVEFVKTKYGNIITLSLGRKCNNACIMCITPAGDLKEPSLQEIKNRIDSIENPAEIYFSGGEPTIRKDFFEIVKYARERHPSSKIGLVTNGRMFSYLNFAKKAFQSGITKVITEIHAPNSNLHDEISGVNGSFEQTTQGINNLLKFPFEIELRMVIHKMNYKYLPDTAKFLSENYPKKIRFVMFPISIIGRAFKEKEKVVVSNKIITPYIEKAADIFLEKGSDMRIFHIPHCIINKKYWRVLPGITTIDGKIYFSKKCDDCAIKPKCSGIWRTYYATMGDNEINPINNEEN